MQTLTRLSVTDTVECWLSSSYSSCNAGYFFQQKAYARIPKDMKCSYSCIAKVQLVVREVPAWEATRNWVRLLNGCMVPEAMVDFVMGVCQT